MWPVYRDVAVRPRALFSVNPITQSRYEKKKYSAVAVSQA